MKIYKVMENFIDFVSVRAMYTEEAMAEAHLSKLKEKGSWGLKENRYWTEEDEVRTELPTEKCEF